MKFEERNVQNVLFYFCLQVYIESMWTIFLDCTTIIFKNNFSSPTMVWSIWCFWTFHEFLTLIEKGWVLCPFLLPTNSRNHQFHFKFVIPFNHLQSVYQKFWSAFQHPRFHSSNDSDIVKRILMKSVVLFFASIFQS